ncbi:MAG: 50S ribosomal protein L4 [Bacillota bacterium]
MPRVPVYNIEGNQVDEIDLNDTIFGIKVNETVMHQVVVMQRANRRRGTSSTKVRSEVSGGGRKPWRQKGTGRARAGSNRSPLWRGGGITFGPQPRDYSYTMPKKVRRLALKSALSSKVLDGNLVVVDEITMQQPKTKDMAKILGSLGVARKALVVTAKMDENVQKSARNIPGITPLTAASLNVYDLLLHDKLVITRDAVNRVEEVLA